MYVRAFFAGKLRSWLSGSLSKYFFVLLMIIKEKNMQRDIRVIIIGAGMKDFVSNVFFRQRAVYLRYSSVTVTLISIALFHARSIPVIPARYPMLNIFSPSGPGSLWALATRTNLNKLYCCNNYLNYSNIHLILFKKKNSIHTHIWLYCNIRIYYK